MINFIIRVHAGHGTPSYYNCKSFSVSICLWSK